MKRLLLSVFMLMGSVNVQAAGLSILNAEAISFSGYSGQPVSFTGDRDSGFTGTVNALFDGNLTAVYLGQESGHLNLFQFEVFNSLNEWQVVGQFINTEVDAGALLFRFVDTSGSSETFENGISRSFAIMDGFISDITGTNYGPFDYILGLNDSSISDGDYDDFVVGLRFQPVSEVPVPAALPLMATALCLFGISRRRQT